MSPAAFILLIGSLLLGGLWYWFWRNEKESRVVTFQKGDAIVDLTMDGERVTRMVTTMEPDEASGETKCATPWDPAATDNFGDIIRLTILDSIAKNATETTLSLENMASLHGATLEVKLTIPPERLRSARIHHGFTAV